MPAPVAVAVDLTRVFGPDAGVFGIDLELSPGAIVGLIGPSGSGKTTTVRLLAGILKPDSGTVRVFGEDPVDFSKETRARLGYMPERAVLFPDLTLADNLRFSASLYGMSARRWRYLDEIVHFVELDGVMGRLPREASGGEKRRVMLAATLAHQPELIFLDEPTAGLDPVLRRKLWDRFEELAGNGRSLLVTTQYVGEAAYCDLVAVLAGGKILALAPPDELRKMAFGGEVLDVVFVEPPDRATAESLAAASSGKTLEWLDRRSVRIVVEDAGSAGPAVVRWAQGRHVELEETEPYLPPFDDVFVEIVSHLGNGEADERGDRP
jgi:ABC-2 type transport system ATP-binding protein